MEQSPPALSVPRNGITSFGIEVAQNIGLQPVSQGAIEEVRRQSWRRPTAKDSVPACPQHLRVNFAQARNLAFDAVPVRWRRTYFDPWHRTQPQGCLTLGAVPGCTFFSSGPGRAPTRSRK